MEYVLSCKKNDVKYTLTTLQFAFAVLLITSCQKEITPTDVPVVTPPPATADSSRLTKYIEIDSVAANSFDTVTVVSIEYDAQKRVTAVISYNSTDPADNLANYEKYFYHYNGSDTLPDRMITQLRIESGSDINSHVDTSFYTYTSTGKLLKDSSNRNLTSNFGLKHYITTRSFDYQSSFFTIVKTDTDPSFAGTTIDSVFLTMANNNISAIRFTNYTLPGYTLEYGHNSTFTYDSKPNPFHKIKALASTIQLYEFDNGPMALLQKNNVTSISQTSLAGETVSENIQYSYHANEYPAVSYSTYNADWGGFQEIRYYKSLYSYN